MRSGAGGIGSGAAGRGGWSKAALVLAMAGLVATARAADPAATATTLDAVVVQGAAADDTGYSAHTGSTGTKTDAPLLETPQSVTVVTREQLEDQGTQGLSSTLRYVAGVAAEAQGFEPSRDWSIAIRGFDATTYGLYHNGMFWDSYSQTEDL
jgi:iron complex outermembrane recepter protein